MRFFARRYFNFVAAATAAALLSACSGNSTIPSSPIRQPQTQNVNPGLTIRQLEPAALLDDAVTPPPACKGQTTTTKSASLKETLATKGGVLCIPAFGGYGGTIDYPSTNPSITTKLTSSTTNIAAYPLLGPAGKKPQFYLGVTLSGATTFGSSGTAGGGLASPHIIVGKAYTVYGQAKISGFPVNLTPFHATAKASPHGGIITGLGALLKGLSVPAAATAVLELYLG